MMIFPAIKSQNLPRREVVLLVYGLFIPTPKLKKIHKKQCLLQMIWLLFMLTTRLTQQSAYLFI